jgi:hypothetical protein
MLNDLQVADVRYWTSPPNGNASTKRCLELSYDESKGAALASADCSTDKKSFICQVSKNLCTCFISGCCKTAQTNSTTIKISIETLFVQLFTAFLYNCDLSNILQKKRNLNQSFAVADNQITENLISGITF